MTQETDPVVPTLPAFWARTRSLSDWEALVGAGVAMGEDRLSAAIDQARKDLAGPVDRKCLCRGVHLQCCPVTKANTGFRLDAFVAASAVIDAGSTVRNNPRS